MRSWPNFVVAAVNTNKCPRSLVPQPKALAAASSFTVVAVCAHPKMIRQIRAAGAQQRDVPKKDFVWYSSHQSIVTQSHLVIIRQLIAK